MTGPPSTPSGQMRAVGIGTEALDEAQATLRAIAGDVLVELEMGSPDTRDLAAAQIAQRARLTLANLALVGHAARAKPPQPVTPDTPRPSRR